jgi:transposase-like protein
VLKGHRKKEEKMVAKAQRKQYDGVIKAKAVIEAIKGERTINEIASVYGVHPLQIPKWKKQVLEELPKIFSRRRDEAAKDEEELKALLYQQIGQLNMELDWLKKKSGLLG